MDLFIPDLVLRKEIILQRSPRSQKPPIKHQTHHILCHPNRQLKPPPSCPIRMNHRLPTRNILNLNSHPALSRRSTPHDIPNHVELFVLRREGKPLRCLDEKARTSLGRWVRVPVVWFLSAADNRATVQRARDAEGKGAVGVLFGEGYGAGVTNEAGLAWIVC